MSSPVLEFKKKPNESVGSLLRRFGRVAQASVVRPGKSKQYATRKHRSNRRSKNAAIMGVALANLRKRLQRRGTYNKETFEEEKKKLKRTISL